MLLPGIVARQVDMVNRLKEAMLILVAKIGHLGLNGSITRLSEIGKDFASATLVVTSSWLTNSTTSEKPA